MASNNSLPSSPISPVSPIDSKMIDSKASSKASSRKSSRSNLSLDLSSIPPLVTPSPPTNTLLITNLKDVEIFRPDHLQGLRDIIASSAHLVSWSPLKSFARIVCSFESEEDAIRVKQELDGEAIMGNRMKIFFGKHTPVTPPTDQHLQAPESQKLFFISPPPSPPVGWEIRNEEPPNALVMPEDLAHALQKLSWNTSGKLTEESKDSTSGTPAIRRQRSGSSTVLFEPSHKGELAMPGITVDDFSDDESSPVSQSPVSQVPIAHTARPPVETMNDA